MPDQIFISHSRDDTNLLDELDRVFGKAGLKQYRASFEDQAPPVSEDLKTQINQSVAMFVVLGRQAQAKTHTMIWIGWEAGIAVQSGIPVWILEDIQARVTQPIPSLSDFVLWDSRDKNQHRILRDILELEFIRGENATPEIFYTPPKKNTHSWSGSHSRNNASYRNSEVSEKTRGVICPYESCGERYLIRFEGVADFNCPSCRQTVEWDLDSKSEPTQRSKTGRYR